MDNTLFLLLVLPITVLIIIVSIIKTEPTPKTRKPPGPRGLPIIGNLHQLKQPLHVYFWQLSKKYGPLFHMKLGSRSVLVANSSRMAQEILKIQDLIFCSRPPLLSFKVTSYDFLDIALAPYGEYWRDMRKVCVLHLLSAKRVLSFRPIREDEVSRMIKIITQKASSYETINLSEMIVFLTSTTICRVAFGRRYDQGSGESVRFNHLIHEFQTAVSCFYLTDYIPWLGWVDKITGKIDNLDKIFKEWDTFYQQLIDEHLDPNRLKSTDDDVIDILLQLREEGSGAFRLSMDHIKAVLVNVYFASADTISTTMVWAMTALIKNPKAMRKVQEEIRALTLLQEKQMVEEKDIEAAGGLPYLNAVIKETMRMYTTLPLLIPRETMAKCTIDGFEIPERFLNDERKLSMDLKGQDFELMPFGVGRRGCPGITMALATMQLVLANLLYLFDWDLPNGMTKEDVDTEIFPGMTSHKKNPLRVVARKMY